MHGATSCYTGNYESGTCPRSLRGGRVKFEPVTLWAQCLPTEPPRPYTSV